VREKHIEYKVWASLGVSIYSKLGEPEWLILLEQKLKLNYYDQDQNTLKKRFDSMIIALF